jgi:hypothetical protein
MATGFDSKKFIEDPSDTVATYPVSTYQESRIPSQGERERERSDRVRRHALILPWPPHREGHTHIFYCEEVRVATRTHADV